MRKAVKRGVDKDLVTQTVDQAIVDVSDRRPPKNGTKKSASRVKGGQKTKRILADDAAA